jgi:hypothetical protein
VLDLSIEGVAGPIGVTPNHPIWSDDRREFVRADDLAVGESLLDAQGARVAVREIVARSGRAEVFNLEVDGEHVYHVSSAGVLVHNNYAKGGASRETATQLAQRLGREGEHAAGITKNSVRIDSLSGRRAFRIPDELTESTLTEVKNVEYQHFSTQLQDSLHYSIMTNRQMILKVREDTILSEDLIRAIKAGWINLEFIK